MIKIDPINLDKPQTYFKISSLLDGINKRKQGFYSYIDDTKYVRKITEYSTLNKGKFDYFVVLGIGGSALGTICLDQALSHLYREKKLFVLDNIDPAMMSEILDVIKLKKTLFMVVTKSGGTPETLSQYYYFRKLIEEHSLKVKKHFIFITDPKIGLLRKIADEEEIQSFEIPENIGGRFSVLTAVGLLPSSLLGMDINKLLKGAKKMRDQFLSERIDKNLPFKLALMQYEMAKKGHTQNVMMVYNQKLIRFADWYRQLLAESTGKEKNNQGKIVNIGLTPINALGVTDQHSQSQLYNEGPNDKFFIFLSAKESGPQIIIPVNPNHEATTYLKNVTFDQLLKTELKATRDSLAKNKRPSILISIDKIDEETLGGLFMLFMGATAFLGEMFDINAFDQPGVETSKILTKKYLTKKNE